MRVYEVVMNGDRLCTAGINGSGVTVGIADTNEHATLHVGASESYTGEYLTWTKTKLDVGDRVLVRILGSGCIDEPQARRRREVEEVEERKRYLRAMAREFGWTLIEPSST
jgi:hypothetical protein